MAREMPLVQLRGSNSGAPLRLLHVSDTHNMHWSIEERFPFPAADILCHTGDLTNNGTLGELESVAQWLQHLSPRFRAIVVIPGNHDWYDTRKAVAAGSLSATEAMAPGYYRSLVSRVAKGGLPANCYVLDHEELVIDGLRIFGSPWCPWCACRRSEGIDNKNPACVQLHEAWQARGGTETHRFGEIPVGVDVLLTHGPAAKIMDCVGTPGRGWGFSEALFNHIRRASVGMHFFGHVHEQRGEWRKHPGGGGYLGGIEYRTSSTAKSFPTTGPPPRDYPCLLISCNAMANHPGLEGVDSKNIAGPARLISVQVPPSPGAPASGGVAAAAAAGGAVAAAAAGAAAAGRTDALMEVASSSGSEGGLGGGRVLVKNSAHGSVLGTGDGESTCMRREGTTDCMWDILECPHEPGSVYFLHTATQKCLDTHGEGVKLWNGGQTIDELIVGNVTTHAGNLRWRIIPCRHQAGTFYIVNTRHGKFLDTHGTGVKVWNNSGKSVDTIIDENTSRHAGNLRWILQACP